MAGPIFQTILLRTRHARKCAAAALNAAHHRLRLQPDRDALRALRAQGRPDLAVRLDRYWMDALDNAGSSFAADPAASAELDGWVQQMAAHAIARNAAHDYLGFVLAVECIALFDCADPEHEPERLVALLAALINQAGQDDADAGGIEAYAVFTLDFIEALARTQAALPPKAPPHLRSVP